MLILFNSRVVVETIPTEQSLLLETIPWVKQSTFGYLCSKLLR